MDNVSRRAFLVGGCAMLALGSTALPAAAQGAIRTLPDGKLAVRLRGVSALSKVGGAVSIGSVKGNPVGVARTGKSTYVAFSLRCPHQGVKVVKNAEGWSCPAHGSQFESDGDLVLGPATTALPKVPARLRGGVLTVG